MTTTTNNIPATHPRAAATAFDAARVRADFPLLSRQAQGRPLVYLDNAATAQKPRAVIDAVTRYYSEQNANIHRGVYSLSQGATLLYEEARRKAQRFLSARESAEVIFTRGATEAINLVAHSWGRWILKAGDEVVVSALEHHSNIVPWQLACEATGALLKVIPVNDAGELLLDEYEKLLGSRTRIVAVTHVSNALGTINDVERITRLAHGVGAKVLIDGAQWVAHFPTDVQKIGCDFYAFSGHKVFGPTGIGVLYGRRELLEAMPPYQGGGDMIETVTFEKTTYAALPNKFEAGTPHIAGAIGLGAAIDYVESVGLERAAAYEEDLLRYATQRLSEIPGLHLVGTARHKAGVISFVMEDPPVAALDIGAHLDVQGVAIRTGHHCCQPLMDRLGIPGTARASLAMYNTRNDVDTLVEAIKEVRTAALLRKPHAPAPAMAGVAFPAAVAASPAAAADELIDVLGFLDDWEQRYQYLEELGEKIPPMPREMKTEAARVHGCQSIVHLVAQQRPDSSGVMEFLADSDASLVRGLIGVLQRLYSGQQVRDVLAFDVESFFKRVGLEQHLSSGRRNGLQSMINRIRSCAQGIAAAPPRAGAVLEGKPAVPLPQVGAAAPPAPPPTEPAPAATLREKIIHAISSVYDPEIPVNIYDLGLIYRVDINEASKRVVVEMTLTTPNCPEAEALPNYVRQAIERLPEVDSAEVNIVWTPPWDRSKMSDEAKIILGME